MADETERIMRQRRGNESVATVQEPPPEPPSDLAERVQKLEWLLPTLESGVVAAGKRRAFLESHAVAADTPPSAWAVLREKLIIEAQSGKNWLLVIGAAIDTAAYLAGVFHGPVFADVLIGLTGLNMFIRGVVDATGNGNTPKAEARAARKAGAP